MNTRTVKRVAEARLPTEFGEFRIIGALLAAVFGIIDYFGIKDRKVSSIPRGTPA